MTETEQSRLYWVNRRRSEREHFEPSSEPEPPGKWRGCDRNCFCCRYPDCMDCGTDMTDFERRCLEIGHQDEEKWRKQSNA